MQSVDKDHLWPLTGRQWAMLALGLLSLWVWRESQAAGCVSLLIGLAMVWVITGYGREYAICYRRCLVSCHLQQQSLVARWLTRRWWINLRALSVALVAVPPLLLVLLTWPDTLLLVLLVDIPLLLLIIWMMAKWVPKWAAADMVLVLGKRWIVLLNAGVLLAALTLIQFYLPSPEPISMNLADALDDSRSRLEWAQVSCPVTMAALQLAQQLDALNWWLVTMASKQTDSVSLRLLVWGGFLLMQSLVAWSFSRFLVQLLYLPVKAQAGHQSDHQSGHQSGHQPGHENG